MPFKMSTDLQYFDVFPLVVAAGVPAVIHIRPIGGAPEFEPGRKYHITVCGMDGASRDFFPKAADVTEFETTATDEGGFEFEHTFTREQGYFLLVNFENGQFLKRFQIYCVEGDLVGRHPFIGDLHMHTCRSDGKQTPEVVCANYRRHGYDFMVVSDHERYYPSLDAIRFYKDLPIGLNIVPGEEVHMPRIDGMKNETHIVNFGGEYSINALVEAKAVMERGKDPSVRSLNGNCPEVMTQQEYADMIRGLCAEAEVPEGVDVFAAVCCKWIFNQIRRAGGLAIFPHPNWIVEDGFHVPESFADYLVREKAFDAFEVLGGENYYEMNGYQTQRYYEDRANGYRYPIVGSTDSHNSLAEDRNSLIGSTIVFARENERKELIDSIKGFYSVAVDTINEDFRLVGDRRLTRYACFLLKNYFPIHDEYCYEEGRMMKLYACGLPEEKEHARVMIGAMAGRVEGLLKKYFAF